MTDEERPEHGTERAIEEAAGGALPPYKKQENPLEKVTAWAKAIGLGIRDTAAAMRDEAREEAQRAQEEKWERYTDLTKRRRQRRDE